MSEPRKLEARVESEFDRARVVLVYKPGPEINHGILWPRAALYADRSIDKLAIYDEHDQFVKALRGEGIRVVDIEKLLFKDESRLFELALESLRYDGMGKKSESKEKEAALRDFSPGRLLNVVLERPVCLWDGLGSTLQTNYEPLSNLMFTRDHMLVTDNSVVICGMREPQRQYELPIIIEVLRQLGIEPLFQVQPQRDNGKNISTVEGGDFYPMGKWALIGSGARTDMKGIQQLFDNKVFGFDEVYVVVDEKQKMDEMHLDTYLGFANSKLALLTRNRMLGGTYRPKVWVYYRQGDTYVLDNDKSLYLDTLLLEKGFSIYPLTQEQQRSHLANTLVIRDGKVFVVGNDSKELVKALRKGIDGPIGLNTSIGEGKYETWRGIMKRYKQNQAPGSDVQVIDFRNLVGMYGSLHCTTQVLVRR